MTYNSIAYLAFFGIMTYVIVVIGWQFYKNGKFYLENIFKNDLHLIDSINKLLLLGYYLFNIGYIAISIQNWATIHTIFDMFGVIAERAGTIIILLGVIHYINLWWLFNFYKIKSFFKSNINQ